MSTLPIITTATFNYDLPEAFIAKYPLANRDESKLLIYKQNIGQTIFKSIDEHLPSNCLLINNNSKVIPARLQFIKSTGGIIEIFCLEPHNTTQEIAMQALGNCQWLCYVGGASKWNSGVQVQWQFKINNAMHTLQASLAEKLSDCYIISFTWDANVSFSQVLEAVGQIPIPPYLKRKAELTDATQYQTVYASVQGSVAAPTAGLHFTPFVMEQLQKKGIHTSSITLHVGAGTFKPITSATVNEHNMHAEWVQIQATTIKQIVAQLQVGKIASVGTTSIRSIESLYWWAAYCYHNKSLENSQFTVPQWLPYQATYNYSAALILNWVLQQMEQNNLTQISFKTQIIIVPGYNFKLIDILITNFHQPNSTLLLLISAFTNNNWQKIYNYALQNNFRFLSYGDSSLLFRE
jgi:S-adenosylmethionine:tRNA ribosyltransferase-isomerase